MKWTHLWFYSLIVLIYSLPIVILLKVIPGIQVSNFWWGVPVFSLLFLMVTYRKTLREQAAYLRNSYREFLEHDKCQPPIDLRDYPPGYVEKIRLISEDLCSSSGMIFAGDYESPGDAFLPGKKIFTRCLRSSDGTIWGEISWLRINILFSFVLKFFGVNPQLPKSAFYLIRENGDLLLFANIRIPSRPIPGIKLIALPGKSPGELLQSILEWEEKIRIEAINPPISMKQEEFQKIIQTREIYLHFQNSLLRFPSVETLKREGFSEAAIEKYRKICLDYPILERNPKT